MNENATIKCGSCSTKNRVPLSRLEENPKCGKCGAPLPEVPVYNHPVDINDGSFDREVLAHPGPVLVDCWAPWCGPCKTIAPALDQLASKYAGRLKIAKLNVDENPATSQKFSIQSIPTMLIFNNGKQVDTMIGALPKNEIEKRLAELI